MYHHEQPVNKRITSEIGIAAGMVFVNGPTFAIPLGMIGNGRKSA
jgi:hypothetical protein